MSSRAALTFARVTALVFITLPTLGCDNDPGLVVPTSRNGSQLAGTASLSDASQLRLEGIYAVARGSTQFGDTVVIARFARGISVFAQPFAAYMVLQAGRRDTSVILEGTWRYAKNTQTGLVRFRVDPADGSAQLLSAAGSQPDPGVLRLRGVIGSGDNDPDVSVQFVRVRPLPAEPPRGFWVLAHRGGGRNSDYPGASENSIELIGKAEEKGATGIEIDVRISKDGVPFLYHDPDVNPRLAQNGLLWGPVEDYTWPQLRSLVTLRNGERIPSLEEALDFVVRKTSLTFVWLDMKSTRNEMPAVVPLQQRYTALAQGMGRRVEVLIGIPDEEHFDRVTAFQGNTPLPTICELNVDHAQRAGSAVWAPRWTEGTLTGETALMHGQQRRVFVWTLDDDTFITKFFREGDFDGVLTNYPSLVRFRHYMR